MSGCRKQQWAAVLQLMTIQPEAWSSTEARFSKPITEERVVINKGNGNRGESSSKDERRVRKEGNQERGQG